MAPSHSISALGSHSAKYKNSKSRPKQAVKPILKKWTHSDREKKSIDLDRGWDEQDDGMKDDAPRVWGRESSLSFYDRAAVIDPDIGASFAVAGAGGGAAPEAGGGVGLGVVVGVVGGTTSTRRFNHSRSISGNSHGSIATSSSSNGISAPRQTGATFVHPFQQTPRTSTPPLLSYANSLASIPDAPDYSPTTITEDGDDVDGDEELADGADSSPKLYRQQLYHPNNSHSNNSSSPHIHHPQTINSSSHSLSQQPSMSLQRPSIASQRTSSYADTINSHTTIQSAQPPLRVKISSRTPSIVPVHSSPLADVSSRSDLNHDYSLDSTSPIIMPGSITAASTMPPISPLRSSLDSGFRLRAKSDLDTATRAEHVRAARRKFEEKERLKDEKYAREEIRRRERADNKRAHEIERELAARHKEELAARVRQEAAELEEAFKRGKHIRKISVASSGRPSLSMPRPSLTLGRPSMSRKNTSNQMSESEKFMSNSYDNTDAHSPPAYGQEPPSASTVRFSSSRRKSTKKKTQSAWTAFVLWLRTRLLRMSKN